MKDTSNCYDMEGIIAQRIYDQDPEAQFHTKELMGILNEIVKENPVECKYAFYLKMALVQGYTMREMEQIEDVPVAVIQERMQDVLRFIKTKVGVFKRKEKKVR